MGDTAFFPNVHLVNLQFAVWCGLSIAMGTVDILDHLLQPCRLYWGKAQCKKWSGQNKTSPTAWDISTTDSKDRLYLEQEHWIYYCSSLPRWIQTTT